jgi:hypothetical protein
MTVAGTPICPLPPDDFAERKVPVIELNLAAVALNRIHRTANDPILFNREAVSGTVFRFDAPAGQYGVLYAAPTISACLFETIVRNKFENGELPLYLGESELARRSASSIGMTDARALRLADFTQSLAAAWWQRYRHVCRRLHVYECVELGGAPASRQFRWHLFPVALFERAMRRPVRPRSVGGARRPHAPVADAWCR